MISAGRSQPSPNWAFRVMTSRASSASRNTSLNGMKYLKRLPMRLNFAIWSIASLYMKSYMNSGTAEPVTAVCAFTLRLTKNCMKKSVRIGGATSTPFSTNQSVTFFWAKGLNFRYISPTIPTLSVFMSLQMALNSSAAVPSISVSLPRLSFFSMLSAARRRYFSFRAAALPGTFSRTAEA